MTFRTLNYIFIFVVSILLTGFFLGKINWKFLIIPFFVWFLVIALSSLNIQWNFFLKAFSSGDSKNNKIALTFDDGPHPIFTPAVLETLEKYKVKASFFCIGKNVKQHPEILEKIKIGMHNIGNHSFSHSNWIDFNGKKAWINELTNADNEFEKAIGEKPILFRPPYGVTTPHLANALNITQHKTIGWNVRSFDTVNKHPDSIVKSILKKTKPGSIILLHDHLPNTAIILEQLIPELQKRKFTFVTIEELMNSRSYESN